MLPFLLFSAYVNKSIPVSPQVACTDLTAKLLKTVLKILSNSGDEIGLHACGNLVSLNSSSHLENWKGTEIQTENRNNIFIVLQFLVNFHKTKF